MSNVGQAIALLLDWRQSLATACVRVNDAASRWYPLVNALFTIHRLILGAVHQLTGATWTHFASAASRHVRCCSPTRAWPNSKR